MRSIKEAMAELPEYVHAIIFVVCLVLILGIVGEDEYQLELQKESTHGN
jgi:hypothetical protein